MADKFLSIKNFSEAACREKDLLSFIQGLQSFYRLKKIPHLEIDEAAKRIFSKFCDSHSGKSPNFMIENIFHERLVNMRILF